MGSAAQDGRGNNGKTIGKAIGAAIGKGARKGVAGSWELIKVIAPVSLAVTALEHTPLLAALSTAFEPLMRWLGLPGEAAVVLVAGQALGIYSALGAMATLQFSPKELLILALMLSFAHNLLVETAVTKRLGVSYWGVMAYRLGLAIVAALVVNAVFGLFAGTGAEFAAELQRAAETGAAPEAGLHAEVAGVPASAADGAAGDIAVVQAEHGPGSGADAAAQVGLEPGSGEDLAAQAGLEPGAEVVPGAGVSAAQGWFSAAFAWIEAVVVDTVQGLARTVTLLIAIIIPLMAAIETLKVTGILERLSNRIEPYMGLLGMSGKAGFPLLAGFVFGLAYGAGVILEAAKDNDLTQGDRRLLCVFLVACHAAIEDTLLFVPVGVNPFLLLGTRVTLALLLTAIAARVGIGTRPSERRVRTA